MRCLLAALALAGVALVGGAQAAWAHSALVGSDPADGSSTATGPATVALRFNEAVQPGFTTVTVVGPDGRQWQGGPPTEDGSVVTVPVQPLGPAGDYTVGYRVLSVDSHPVQGSVRFTLTEPGLGTAAAPAPSGASGAATAGEPTAAPADPQDGGVPVWPWIVGAVVLLAAGVAAALRLGRSS